MSKKPKMCIKCNQDRDVGRKMCRECYLKHKRECAKNRYQNDPFTRRIKIICEVCKKEYLGWRKEQKHCSNCWKLNKKLAKETLSSNQYKMIGAKCEHREIAKSILGKLSYNMVIHHVDNNYKNNDVKNLMVMDRRTHGRLHKYLDLQRAIIEKSMNENRGNCWNTLIVPMTTAWLETTGAKVIKLWEIGQSAAEPL
jgi:hypothetical protein